MKHRAFTLIELLVVMGIIAIITGITIVTVGAIRKDTNISIGTNLVKGQLALTRAIAIRSGEKTALIFRSRVVDGVDVTELLIANETKEQRLFNFTMRHQVLATRLSITNKTEVKRLPPGINIATPAYHLNKDDLWVTGSRFTKRPFEAPGIVFGVIFAGDGSLDTFGWIDESMSTSQISWLDFNSDGEQSLDGDLLFQETENSEVAIMTAVTLAIYDDNQAREYCNETNWNDSEVKNTALSAYIDEFAKRLAFNRYTGMVLD